MLPEVPEYLGYCHAVIKSCEGAKPSICKDIDKLATMIVMDYRRQKEINEKKAQDLRDKLFTDPNGESIFQ